VKFVGKVFMIKEASVSIIARTLVSSLSMHLWENFFTELDCC